MRRQRIVETITCDKCGEDTDTATSYTVQIKRLAHPGPPIRRNVDLCPTCVPLLTVWHDVLRSLARNVEPERNAAERQLGDMAACKVCGAELRRAVLSSHIVKKHRAHAPQPPECPDCGRKLSSAAEMIKHRAREHGYEHAAALYASLQPQPKGKRAR